MIFAQLLAFAILAFAVSDALKLKNCGKRFFQVIKSNGFLESYQPKHDLQLLGGNFSLSVFLHKELEICQNTLRNIFI